MIGQVTTLSGMAVVLVLSYGLDRIWDFLRQENGRTFNVMPSLWLAGIFELAFALAVLAFGWLALFKTEKNSTVSVVLLGLGLVLLFSSLLWALFPTVPLQTVFGPFLGLFIVSPSSYERHAAAFFAIMGAVGLIGGSRAFPRGTRAPAAASHL